MTTVTVACIQMQSGPDMTANMQHAGAQLREAKKRGAELVVLPENVALMSNSRTLRFAKAAAEVEHEAVRTFTALARECGLWVVAGSIAIKMTAERLANRCLVINPLGAIVARYDKIHLFDADPKPGETYRESDDYMAGERAVKLDTPWGMLGLSICYDVRFAALYRALAKAGAQMITVPAAFARTTGIAHWHTLLRARAIENGCYIIAAAQTGTHEGGRKTFGHSLIVDPWGEILADAGEEPGLILATLNLATVNEVRRALPCLQHDRQFVGP